MWDYPQPCIFTVLILITKNMRTIRLFAISSLFLAFSLASYAQLKVDSTGRVSICSTNSNFLPRLKVGNSFIGSSNAFSYGLTSTPLLQDNKKNVSIEGYIDSNQSFTSETNIGVAGCVRVNTSHGRNFGLLPSGPFTKPCVLTMRASTSCAFSASVIVRSSASTFSSTSGGKSFSAPSRCRILMSK